MKIIKIQLPEDIEKQISLMNKNQQDFILDAIREKINKREALNTELKEGYQTTYKEDIKLTNDFESADLEDLK
ncbi:hypothetical protein BH23BAC1_BH23BAC1_10210 [soil metagenome]